MSSPSAKYILVDWDQDIMCFNEKQLYEYLNKGWEDDDTGETEDYEVLKKFPDPSDDKEGGYFSPNQTSYCPFTERIWPRGSVFILRNGVTFVPQKREVTKLTTRVEYAPPKRIRAKKPAAKAAAKKASAK